MTTPVTFRCKQSGHTVTFTAPVDIDSMKGHDGYEKVQEQQEAPKEVLTSKKAVKKAAETPAEAE